MLDGKAATPLYVQLMERLEENIRNGTYASGERLQSEIEMSKTYGVSIITVRNAVGALIDKGLVVRKQGKGTFVAKPRYTRNIKELQGFSELCRHMGVKPGGRMLENKLTVPTEKIAGQLKIPQGSQAVYISRVRDADQEPVAIEYSYFPLKYAFLLGETFDSQSLFSFLKEKADVAVVSSEKKIEICHATAKEAELLNIKRGDALLYIKSVAYDKNNEPIYAGTQIMNGERFYLYVYQTTT